MDEGMQTILESVVKKREKVEEKQVELNASKMKIINQQKALEINMKQSLEQCLETNQKENNLIQTLLTKRKFCELNVKMEEENEFIQKSRQKIVKTCSSLVLR